MNNQNNMNSQFNNQTSSQNNQQPIQFGNSLSGNNNFNNSNQINGINQNNSYNANMNYGVPNYQNPNPEVGNNQSNNNFSNFQPQNQINQNNYQEFSKINNGPIGNSNNLENKPKKKNKFLILVLVIVIIYILFQVITLMISSKGVNSQLDNTRKSAFLSSARSYISNAKFLVNDDIKGKYKPECTINDFKYISLADLTSDSKSPFGAYYQIGLKYNKGLDSIPTDSYIKIETINNNCDYEYSIYLTDGKHKIGTSSTPILETELDILDVK